MQIGKKRDSQILFLPGGSIVLALSIRCVWRALGSHLLTWVVPILSSIDTAMMTSTAPPPSVINYHVVLHRAVNTTCNHSLLLNCISICKAMPNRTQLGSIKTQISQNNSTTPGQPSSARVIPLGKDSAIFPNGGANQSAGFVR